MHRSLFTGLLFALVTAKMVRRKIPKAELRRHIRETPFTRDEVQKLWNRFEGMDGDGSGRLNYQVGLEAYSVGAATSILLAYAP